MSVSGDWKRQLKVYGFALGLSLVVTVIVVLALGGNPLVAFRAALHDTLGSVGGFGQVLNRMTPLLLASLTFAIGYHAGLFNIGMDGQIYAGGVTAVGMGFLLGGTGLSAWVVVPLVILAGFAGGALFAAIPAAMRVIWGVNEIFTTVMLNFVALYLVEYLCTGPWNDPVAGEAITLPLARSAVLPSLGFGTGAHIGVFLAILVGIGLWWGLYRTVPGYQLRAVGSNDRAAKVGGIRVGSVQLLALVVGGAISGLAGAIEVSGVHERLLLGLSPQYGIMAILIAVLGRFHPALLIPVNFAFALLVAASDSLQRTVGFPAAGVLMLQAVVVIVVMGAEALHARKHRFVV